MSQQLQQAEQIRALIASCSSPENAKMKELLLEQFYKNESFFAILEYLLGNPKGKSPTLQQQHAANLIDRTIKKRIDDDPKPIHFQKVFAFFTRALLDWNLPYAAKKLFFSSFQESLNFWQEEMDEFWEAVAEALIELTELALQPSSQQFLCKNIKSTCLAEPFALVLEQPVNKNEVYLTIIFFLSVFFDNFQLRSCAYQDRGIDMLKRVHRQIFNECFILQHTAVIKKLLEFEHEFILHMMDDKNMRSAATTICSWDEYTQDVQNILLMKAVPFKDHPDSVNIFQLTEHWESPGLMDLKTTALNITNHLLSISEMLLEINEESFIAISLDFISNSVFYSLLWLVESHRPPSEHEHFLELALLDNLFLYVSIFKMEVPQFKEILTKLLLPIIAQETKQAITVFEANCEGLDELIDSCLSGEGGVDRLSSACKILEFVLRGQKQMESYLKSYVISTLALKSPSSLSTLPLDSEEARDLPPLSIEACFLILSVITGQTSHIQEQALRSILTEETFLSLGISEKQYLYIYLCLSWESLYDERNPGDFLFNYLFKEGCEPEVEYFALEFIQNIINQYYFEDFTRKFLQKFDQLHHSELAFRVLGKILYKYLDRINQYAACILVSRCVAQAKLKAKKIIAKINNPDSSEQAPESYEIARCLQICRQIARAHDYVRGKPDLIASLVSAFKTTALMCKIQVQDEAIFIGAELLAGLKLFPEGFMPVISAVVDSFKNSEYNGIAYYQFFGGCMETISSYPFDQSMGELASQIYNAIAEAYAYFIHYPDSIQLDQCENLGNIEVLLLNVFILFGDKLAEEWIHETERLCLQLQRAESYKEEIMLVVRAQTLLLLCQILTSKQYPLQEIYALAKNKSYFGKCDSILLIYLLNQIRPEVTPEDHFTLVVTVLQMLRSADAFKINRNLRFKQKIKRYNKIFSFITYPIDMTLTELHQANQFFQDYGKEDSATLDLVISELSKGMVDKQLLKYIQKIKTVESHEMLNLGLYDPNEESDSQKNSEDEGQVNKKRKIVKIIGMNGSNQVTYTPSTGKRDMRAAVRNHEESRNLEKAFQKRRKMNELLPQPAEKSTKREIMMQKMSKKSTRI